MKYLPVRDEQSTYVHKQTYVINQILIFFFQNTEKMQVNGIDQTSAMTYVLHQPCWSRLQVLENSLKGKPAIANTQASNAVYTLYTLYKITY